MISVAIDLSPALRRLANAPAGVLSRATRLAARRAAEGYAEDVLEWIRAGHSYTPAPPRDGITIEQGIGWRPQGEGAVVYSQAPHGEYVEYDTAPHVIRPRPGRKALRWFAGGAGGGMVIRRAVQHPGTTAQPFFYADMAARKGRMLQAAREAVAEVLSA